MACIGEPISWLRLERFALGAPDPAIASHVEACPACRDCLAQIRDDVVALPPLAIPVRRRAAWRWWWIAPAFAAAVALIVVLRPPGVPRAVVGVKGVGEVALELVRERRGAIRYDAASYAPGDRWKVVVTCASPSQVWIDVSVADGSTTDHPLAPAQLPCGNRVVLPGAFTITGNRDNRVCARVAAAAGGEAGTACLTLRPE
jgi:hypothetical protein